MEYILKIRNLTKRFGSFTAVNQISFDIEKGNVYGLLGPNGSGKSTTLGMLLNVVNKTSGEYEWFEGKLNRHKALKRVGAIIERPNFYPYMSAEDNLKLVCKIKEISTDKINEKLALVGLLERKKSKFRQFSLGMKQRLAIASALLNDPDILILDEPTNGLDPQGIQQIRYLIQHIASKGTTVLLASHLLDEVEKVCSHVVVMRNGQALYAGKVDEITHSHGYFELQSNQMEMLEKFIISDTHFGKISKENNLIKAFLNQPMEADTLNEIVFKNGITLSHLVKKKESLEEQFLQLTNNPSQQN